MKQKIIETKQDWAWYFIYEYLYLLDNFAAAHTDDGYKKLLKELRDYVAEKIEINGEVIDFYVTVLHKPED